MSTEPQLFRVNPSTKESLKVSEANFADLGLQERTDIQEWVVANPSILGDDLLIIAKEFSDFDRTNERLDLLAIDRDGKLVIIELKRDYSGVDAHWQAIKYASYLRRTTGQQVVDLLAAHEDITASDAEERLIEHTSSETTENLNSDQRIILASHRFAPEVTSAVLWLNDKALGENLITCIQLIPHQDGNTLYLQSNTIIPVPGTERYTVQIGRGDEDEPSRSAGLQTSSRTRYRNDEITQFVRKVERRTLEKLPDPLKTDSDHAWARGGKPRYYSMWYQNRSPWEPVLFSYVINVSKRPDSRFNVINYFEMYKRHLRRQLKFTDDDIARLKHFLEETAQYPVIDMGILRPKDIVIEGASNLDNALVEQTANSLAKMIETFTPKIEDFIKSHTPSAKS